MERDQRIDAPVRHHRPVRGSDDKAEKPWRRKKESRNRWLPGSNCRWRAYDLGLARRSPVAKRDLARVIYILTAALHTNMGLIVCTPSVPVFFFFFFFFVL